MVLILKKYNYENWNKRINHYQEYNDVKAVLKCSSKNVISPDVSIMIPTYKRAKYIGDTINSVLEQTYNGAINIIIVDNGGEDKSTYNLAKEYCQKYDNILYYQNERNIGMAGNWNRCIELARSKWMVILHDDDMLKENYLEVVMPIAEKSQCTLAGVFQEKLVQISSNENQGKEFNRSQAIAQKILGLCRFGKPFQVYNKDLFQFVTPSAGCWFMNRDFQLQLGGYDPQFGGVVDGIFNFNNTVNGKTIIIPQFLMTRRIGDNAFLSRESQMNVCNMLYNFGLFYLPNFNNQRKLKYILDISTTYLVHGIKQKYGATFDCKSVLKELGVSHKIYRLSYHVIFILNSLLLTKLIFRKNIAS